MLHVLQDARILQSVGMGGTENALFRRKHRFEHLLALDKLPLEKARDIARLLADISVYGCSAPSTRF